MAHTNAVAWVDAMDEADVAKALQMEGCSNVHPESINRRAFDREPIPPARVSLAALKLRDLLS